MNVMESDQQHTKRETAIQHWRSCKLIIDPALTNGSYKVYRYDGEYFNIPVRDLGVFPVESVRDPRICRLWSKCERLGLTVPKFKIDEYYVGPIPPKEVTFARLNDNIREDFLSDMCKKYGQIDEVEIFYNPKNKKHLGIGKVIFDTVKAAKDSVLQLHETPAMGNIIHVEIDSKGENRSRYLQLLLSGLYTPWTLPVGCDEQTLQSLVDSLQGSKSMNKRGTISSPLSVATPLSLDTAYSSIWLDTPSSFGLTPHSQGTPHTPCWSGTPLSQDSCYSSMQATPVLQAEPSIYSGHKPFRREVCYRKPARHHGRRSRNDSDVSSILKHLSSQRSLPASPNPTATSDKQKPVLWGENTLPSAHRSTESHLPPLSPEPRELLTSAPSASPLNYNSATVLRIHVSADNQAVSSPPRILELPHTPVETSPGSPHPETESLDSRIEMLLNKSQGFKGRGVEALECARFFPVSDVLRDCTAETVGIPSSSHQLFINGLVDVSPTPLPFEDQEETAQAVASLLRNSQSPAPSPCPPPVQRQVKANQVTTHRNKNRFPQDCDVPDEDKESFSTKPSGALTSRVTSSFTHHAPSFSLKRTPFNPPNESMPEKFHAQAPPLTFPIPLAIPPFPVPLPNGRISFPPPHWMPPPGHHAIPMPPPTIPPPPALLGPPPPLFAPPSVAVHGPFWPRFNPFVPPPGYMPVVDNPHEATVEKVLEAIVDELKSIIRKDITRRMVEGAAFKAFDEWWEGQENKAKTVVVPMKAGPGRVEERTKPAHFLSHIIGQSKPPLPSFKVKKKTIHQTTLKDVPENMSAAAYESNIHLENAGVREGSDNTKLISEKAKCKEVVGLSLKRRHARPLHLDSDDDVQEDEDSKLNKEDMTFDKGENVVATKPAKDVSKVQYDLYDDDVEEEIDNKESRQFEETIISISPERGQFSDGGILSEADTSTSEDDDESSSDYNLSDPYSSATSEDSYDDLSSEDDEGSGAYNKEASGDDCIVISSDEELMELGPPATPKAPLTPGTQFEEGLPDWSEEGLPSNPGEDQHIAGQHSPHVSDLVMEFQTSEHQDLLQPPSPIGLPVSEPTFDVEMESPEWSVDSPGNIDDMRPLTPTGSLVDSEPDLLMSSRPTPPAVEEEEECPHTPGQGLGTQLESEDSIDKLISLPPSSPESILSPFEPRDSYPVCQDPPRTPGMDESGCRAHISRRAPATPGRGAGGNVFVCTDPYRRAPQTPGRDRKLWRRSAVHRRRTPMVTSSSRDTCEFLRGSPAAMPSPCSLSDSSASPSGKGAWTHRSGPRAEPLRGLENMPGRLAEEHHHRETKEDTSLRREQWRWERRRRKRERSMKRPGRPPRCRPRCAERRILHGIWREGLDEEDARLLQVTYDRLLQQDGALGWLSGTRWIPHPLTSTSTCVNVELLCWPKNHRTGSARSEGFYKISSKDKIKYLNNMWPVSQLPTSQGMCIPSQPLVSLRAGSDFRSEQRRLLSSFSCDSDLVKFNQLKFRKKRISFCRSHIHDWGLFAMEPIAADEMVIEYVGQTIRQEIADMREKRYEDEGIGSSYLFRIDNDTIIDATKCGNLARFINHSCTPNCYAKIITVESQKKIVIYSRQPIGINEEITYDYKFPIEDEKIPCLCGTVTCRGSLN